MIAAKDFEQLMNQARVTLIGASDAGLKGALYDVMTEFFNDSSCWTQQIPLTIVPTSTIYPIQVNEGQIIRLVGCWVPCTPDGQSDTGYPQGVALPALMDEVGLLRLANAPNDTTNIVVEVVTNVSLPTGKDRIPIAPDWALPIWHVGILDGLLGKMMLQPGKSYTDKQLAAYHLKRFRDAIARARVSKLRANTNGAQAWRFPQSFRTGSQQGGVPATSGGTDRTF